MKCPGECKESGRTILWKSGRVKDFPIQHQFAFTPLYLKFGIRQKDQILKINQNKNYCVLIWARSSMAASSQTFTLKHLRYRKSVIQTVALIESNSCHSFWFVFYITALLFTFASRSVALTLRHSFVLTLCCWPSLPMSWSQLLFSSLGQRHLLGFLFQPCQRQPLLIWVDGRDVWQVESPSQPSGSHSDLARPGPDEKASLRTNGYNNVVRVLITTLPSSSRS